MSVKWACKENSKTEPDTRRVKQEMEIGRAKRDRNAQLGQAEALVFSEGGPFDEPTEVKHDTPDAESTRAHAQPPVTGGELCRINIGSSKSIIFARRSEQQRNKGA